MNLILPIQAAALFHEERNTFSFIPLLAEEGDKLNVGGEGQRGGLLAEYAEGLTALQIDFNDVGNVLQILAGHCSYYDSFCLDLLKRLRQSQLLKKENVRQYDLLFSIM